MPERASWYSRKDDAAILDDAKLKVLGEAAQQVCGIYFQIDLEELWHALEEDERVKEVTLGDGLLAPAPSPVLTGTSNTQTSSGSMISTKDSVASMRSDIPQLRRHTEGAKSNKLTEKR